MSIMCGPLKVAVTGGIACGKTLFSSMLAESGVKVLDSDEVVHRLEAPGGLAVEPIVKRFGSSVLDRKGGIDRQVLAQKVFSDPKLLTALNGIVHPLVRQSIAEWVDACKECIAAVDIPLLFEVGWQDDWDVVVCVAASEAAQIDRMIKIRGYTPLEARRRLSAQMPVSEKAARSHLVVWNDGGLEELAAEVRRVHLALLEKSHAKSYRREGRT